MSLRVLAVADEVSPLLYDHFDGKQWQDLDFIISCGDLHPGYLDYLATKLGLPVLYVRGNHDGSYPDEDYTVGQNLHARIVEYRGLKIAGFEGCRRYNHGSPQYTDREMNAFIRRTRLSTLRHGTPDILVTHTPPLGIHDRDDVCHRGFSGFTKLIDRWAPKFVIHGHTHAYDHGPSMSVVGDTTVINAFPYHVFEIAEPVAESPSPTLFNAPQAVPRIEQGPTTP